MASLADLMQQAIPSASSLPPQTAYLDPDYSFYTSLVVLAIVVAYFVTQFAIHTSFAHLVIDNEAEKKDRKAKKTKGPSWSNRMDDTNSLGFRTANVVPTTLFYIAIGLILVSTMLLFFPGYKKVYVTTATDPKINALALTSFFGTWILLYLTGLWENSRIKASARDVGLWFIPHTAVMIALCIIQIITFSTFTYEFGLSTDTTNMPLQWLLGSIVVSVAAAVGALIMMVANWIVKDQ